MSINKAVIYLWLAALICCTWTVVMARRMQLKPNGTQTFTEVIYEFAYDTIAKATLGEKVFSRYMPYVASLFMFLWVVNMISFFPLPFGEHHNFFGLPDLGLYAATSNINVTLALTLVTFIASHYEGIRLNGPKKYFGSWAPPGNLGMKIAIWPLHALSELLRLVSLSVRLFANMLAGHLLILMMLGLIIITGYGLVAIGTVPIALFFYLFEFGLVATLQAFIFAMLSGIYIGFAAEPAH
jgi:F-type H+-transporting ATPase subunit a